MMNANRVRAIARKETIQIRRDPLSLALAFFMPVMLLFIFGYAITVDVDRLTTVVCDRDGSSLSREIVRGIEASGYFTVVAHVKDPALIDRALDEGSARVALSIPEDFSRYARTGGDPQFQVIVDGSDSNTATIALGYLNTAPEAAAARRAGLASLRPRHRRPSPRLVQPGASPAILSSRGSSPSSWPSSPPSSRPSPSPGMGAGNDGAARFHAREAGGARRREAGPLLRHRHHRHRHVHRDRRGALRGAPQGECPSPPVHLVPLPLRGAQPGYPPVDRDEIAAGGKPGRRHHILSAGAPLSGFMFSIATAAPRAITYLIPARYFVSAIKGIFLKANTAGMLLTEMGLLALFGVIVFTLAVKRFKKKVA